MAENDFMSRYVAAWGEVNNPKLDSRNPRFNNKYASLHAMLGSIRHIMAKHALTIDNPIVTDEAGNDWMITKIRAADGSIELGRVPFVSYDDPQKNGSSLTYSKRQSLQAAFALAGEEDDDGNAASTSTEKKPRNASKPKAATPPKPTPTDAEKDELAEIAKALGGDKGAVWAAFQANGIEGARALVAINPEQVELFDQDQSF